MALLSATTAGKNYIAGIAGKQEFTRTRKVSASTIASAAAAKSVEAAGYVFITGKSTVARCVCSHEINTGLSDYYYYNYYYYLMK